MGDIFSSKLVNEQMTAAFGSELADSALAKTIEAVSHPVLDEQALRVLAGARAPIFDALKIPDITQYWRTHEWMPPCIVQQLESSTAAVKSSIDAISSSIAETVRLAGSTGCGLTPLFESSAAFHGVFGIADALEAVDWAHFQDRMAKLPEGEQALEHAGYSFSKERWAVSFFVELAETEPTEREQAVDEALLACTQDTEFWSELVYYLQSSPLLQCRYRVCERAIRAHREGDYLVSIPLLLTQIEGVVSDFLAVRRCATIFNGKLYKLDSTGSLKLDKNGKRQEFIGLHSNVERLRMINAREEI